MADLKPAAAPDHSRIEEEANCFLEECRAQRGHIRQDLEECYYFVAPSRHRWATSNGGSSMTPPKDAPELMISIGMEVAQDFGTEVIYSFMPQEGQWAEYTPGDAVSNDDFEDIKEDVEKATEVTFASIKASNLYSALAQTIYPDLAIGTAAVWIDDLDQSKPPECRAVPSTELEIDLAADGTIGARFVVRRTKRRHLPGLLPGVDLPKGYGDKKDGKKDCEVRWGAWPIYGRNEKTWQYVVMIDKKVVQQRELVGEGSCPIIVFRWGADPKFPWGNGPTRQCLPEFRSLDEIEALKTENADMQIHPPFAYPDDGVINFEAGVEPGFGYPARPGGGKDFVSLAFSGNVDFAQFTVMEREQRVKRLHFVDFPVQRGDTPPTATQWSDEMALRQRRFGLPGQTFWREGPFEILKRFQFILNKRGKLPKIEVNGRPLALVPRNAAEAAQDMQDVATAGRLLQTIMGFFPQVGQAAVDPIETIKNLKGKMRDKIVVIQTKEQLKEAATQLAPLLQGAAPQGMPPA